MKYLSMRQLVGFLVGLLVVTSISCSVNGIRVDHVNTPDTGQVTEIPTPSSNTQDLGLEEQNPASESSTTNPKKKEHNAGDYPNDRDWPAKWEQWHRYSLMTYCEIDKEGWTNCEYYLCSDENSVSDEQHPYYVGKHINHPRKLTNKYYLTRCSVTGSQRLNRRSVSS